MFTWILAGVVLLLIAIPVVSAGRVMLFGPPKIGKPQPDPTLLTLDIDFAVGEENVGARLYQRPGVNPTAAVMWMHGGGFVSGSLNMPEGDEVCRTFAHAGFLVLNVDYRLACPRWGATRWRGAPAVRFPTPILDCQAAWNRLLQEAKARGIAGDRMFLGGASAGGNLAVQTVLWNTRQGIDAPAGVMLAYPLLHARPPGARARSGFMDRLLVALGVQWGTRCLMGSTDPKRLESAYPRVDDLPGFPPTVVITGDTDPLRGSGEAFAADLAKVGTPVTIRHEPGTWHGHLDKPATAPFEKTMVSFVHWIEGCRGSSKAS